MATETGTQRLLHKALVVTRPGTKYGLAKRLNMTPSNLNAALAGKLNLGAKPSILLAEVLDLEPMDVLAVTQADAARSAADREWWHRRVPRFLQALALGLALVSGGGWYLPKHAVAAEVREPIYIMRPRKRRAA